MPAAKTSFAHTSRFRDGDEGADRANILCAHSKILNGEAGRGLREHPFAKEERLRESRGRFSRACGHALVNRAVASADAAAERPRAFIQWVTEVRR